MDGEKMVSVKFFDRNGASIYATMTGGFWEGPYMDDRGAVFYLTWFREKNRKPVVGRPEPWFR